MGAIEADSTIEAEGMAVVGVESQEERGEDIEVAPQVLQTTAVVFACRVGVLYTKTRAEIPLVGERMLEVSIERIDMFVEGDLVVTLTHGALGIVVASVGGAVHVPLTPQSPAVPLPIGSV